MVDSPVAKLIELQNTDIAIKNIGAQKNKMPKRFSALEDKRKQAEAMLEEARACVIELTKKQKEKESALLKAGDELRKAKSKQFEVRTNKEFEAVLKEMETMELKIGHIEEEIILIFDEIEQAKADLTSRETEYSEFMHGYELRRSELDIVSRTYDDDLARLSAVQQALKSSLSTEFAKKYEAIKNLHAGLAVVPVVNGTCQGCFMNIPPQMNNELMINRQVRFCPRCNRIIFFEQAAQEA